MEQEWGAERTCGAQFLVTSQRLAEATPIQKLPARTCCVKGRDQSLTVSLAHDTKLAALDHWVWHNTPLDKRKWPMAPRVPLVADPCGFSGVVGT